MKQILPKKQKIIWPNNSYFFLTSSTSFHYPYFKTPEQKQIVLNKFKQIKETLHVPFQSYSIAINHFHILFYLKSGKTMPKVKNILHSGISREYKKIYQIKYENFWQTAKTYFVKDEKMYWKIIGYITGNPLKHREISRFKDLKENVFCSYKYYTQKYGEETMQELIKSIININEDNDGVVNFKDLSDLKTTEIISKPLPWAG